MHNYAKMSSLRFCHERGQNKRWGAVRHVKRSGISIRVFLIFIVFSEKNFSDVWTFHDFRTFFVWRCWSEWVRNGPELVGDGPKGLRNTSGPLLGKHILFKKTSQHHETSRYLKTVFVFSSENNMKNTKTRIEIPLRLTCRTAPHLLF